MRLTCTTSSYRKLADRELMLSFLGLAVFFLAITVPLVLSREWITVSWAIQAFVMLWLAGKLKSEFLRQVAYLLYGIVLLRFGFLDLPNQYLLPRAGRHAPLAGGLRGPPGASGWWSSACRSPRWPGPAVCSRTRPRPSGLAVDRANDVAQWVRTRWAVQAALAVALGMLFVFLHLELNRSAGYLFPACRMPVLSLLWLAMCWVFLREYQASSPAARAGLARALRRRAADQAVCLRPEFLEPRARRWSTRAAIPSWIARCGCSISVPSSRSWCWRTAGLSGRETQAGARALAGSLALVLGFVFLTLELNTFLFHFVPALRAGGISILWSLFALG